MPKSTPAKRAEIFLFRIRQAQEFVSAAMASAQVLMEEQTNRKRNTSIKFHGDKVWLNLKNIQTPQPKKNWHG